MSGTTIINIGKQFSRFPAGRYKKDGPASGEQFRDDVVKPLLKNTAIEKIIIELDDALGYGSSFLEEAFGGLVRDGFSSSQLTEHIEFVSDDLSLIDEIKDYIAQAGKKND